MSNIVLNYLRPAKAARFASLAGGYADATGTLGTHEYSDCAISPLGQIPGASHAQESGLIVDDCDFCARIATASKSTYTAIEGKVLYGGYLRSQWGHFLMNSTARLWALFCGDTIANYDKILFFADSPHFELTGNYRALFDLLGITDKVVIRHTAVSVESITVADISFEHPVKFSTEFLAPFHAAVAAVPAVNSANATGKIFLTRSALRGAKRNEINISALDAFFAAAGYQVIAPETMPLSNLISLLAGASHIAAISGTLAHNFLFAPPGAELIVVERTAVCNPFQAGISRMLPNTQLFVDAFSLPKPVYSTGALFFYDDTQQLADFARSCGISQLPFPTNDSQRRRNLSHFLSRAEALYGHAFGIREWEHDDLAAVAEACEDTECRYAKWMLGNAPLMMRDYFNPRLVAKALLRLLRRTGS